MIEVEFVFGLLTAGVFKIFWRSISRMNLSSLESLSTTRRRFLVASLGGLAAPFVPGAGAAERRPPGGLQIARFRFDVTPPRGHSLCGGWIKPVAGVDDPLEAIGYVLLGWGKPIVVCVVDWTGLLNGAHRRWCQALAEAAGTTLDRVAVHCVHQHNAPFACWDSQEIVSAYPELPHIIEPGFFERCLDQGRAAVRNALQRTRSVTHVAVGEALVDRVASNRRIVGLNGKVVSQRGSSSRSPAAHRYPEGLIDPVLKTVAFYDGDEKLVASHYYACHPMSYYGDGRVSADFCGLARKERQRAEPQCWHLYFNGCGGNIGAGKYNDGSKARRTVLMRRMLQGMVSAEQQLKPEPIHSLGWTTSEVPALANEAFDLVALERQIADPSQSVVNRNRPSYAVAWLRRVVARQPIAISALHVNQASLLHLPAECFVEYQLRAQASVPERFVACAGYGDGGPWYIPTKEAFPQGGYAVSVSWSGAGTDALLSEGIAALLAGAKVQ